MTTKENLRAQALAALKAAFEGVRLEDGVSLHEADVTDDYGCERERKAARALDPEVDWRDVPTRELERMSWVWSYFDAKGFRFYLPAILTWWLVACTDPEADCTAVTSVLDSLRGKRGKFRSISDEHVRLLSRPQMEAILLCLDCLDIGDPFLHEDARRAARSIRQRLE